MLTKRFSLTYVVLALCLSPQLLTASAQDRIGFTVPAAPWTLTLPKGNLVVENQRIKPDGRYGYFLLTDKKGISISFFIEPAIKCKDSKTCRDMVRDAGNPGWENPQNLVSSEFGDVSYFEFFIPSFRGMPIKQQNLYAQFVNEGFWVDLHISKTLYQPDEHEIFERIVKSIRFEPKTKKED